MEGTKSFEELLNEMDLKPRRFASGEKIEAVIVKITEDWVFIDLGAKSEGCIDRREFLDEKGTLKVQEGDLITAYFLSSRHGEKLFTTRLLTAKSINDFLRDAHRKQIPLEAQVEKEVKGGFAVKMNQTITGFCPFSQMDLKRIDDVKAYLGRKFEFVITEYSENGRNIILSRRPILERIEKEKIAALKSSLQKGMVVQGVVTSVQNFGAFVDLGGVEALLPVSEMRWSKVDDPKVLYAPGDAVRAVVVDMDLERDRITLSARETLPHPWEDFVKKYAEGSIVRGRVSHLSKFGAFVVLEDGVEGLLHITRLARGKKIKHASDVVKAGEVIDVKIEKIDRENRKVSLDVAGRDQGASEPADEEDFRAYLARSPKAMGTLGDVLKKKKE